jgi:glycosyltransferase 2 family protein
MLDRLKPYLRYVIVTATLLFVGKSFWSHWQDVVKIQINPSGWGLFAIAFVVTCFSFIWAGWVWLLILNEFQQKANLFWALQIFLITNLGKYLPGNIWQFYGRIISSIDVGISPSVAIISVLLEPLLMAADGLLLAVLGSSLENRLLVGLGLVGILIAIHPRILNKVLQRFAKSKLSKKALTRRRELVTDNSPLESGDNLSDKLSPIDDTEWDKTTIEITRYPLLPLLGEMGFIVLRGSGFLLTLYALTPVSLVDIPQLLSGFSFAYVLGLVVPGAPGGLGVFEASAIALLSHRFAPGVLISAVAFYRVISILAEVTGAGVAWMTKPQKLSVKNLD